MEPLDMKNIPEVMYWEPGDLLGGSAPQIEVPIDYQPLDPALAENLGIEQPVGVPYALFRIDTTKKPDPDLGAPYRFVRVNWIK